MRNVLRFLGVTTGAGVVLGGVLVIMLWHGKPEAAPVAVKPGTVSLNDSLSASGAGGQVTPGLSVSANGNQGMVAGDSTSGQGGSGSAGGSAAAGSGSGSGAANGNGLPTPSQFKVYDQYKNNATALYIDTKPGTGKAVAQGSEVTMQYRGWLTDGTEFDETYARGQAYTFKEGDGTVIAGVAEAMFGMKAGGTRRLIIPAAVGYGAAGHNPIPPDAVMVFDVELVSVQ